MSSFFSARKTARTTSAPSPLERVQDLQASFFKRVSAPPSLSLPSSLSDPPGKLRGGVSLTGSTLSDSLVLVNDSSIVCGGVIGVGGKFCLKPKKECLIVKHQKDRFIELEVGIYLRGTGTDAYCTPCIPKNDLKPEVIEALLHEEFSDLGEARKMLDSVLAVEGQIHDASDLRKILKPPVPKFATPIKREPTDLNLRAKFETFLMVQKNEEGEEGTNLEEVQKAKMFNDYLIELTSTVEANQSDLEQLSDKVFDISSQLGVPPKAGPPTLWLGHMELKSDVEDTANELKRKADASTIQSSKDVELQVEELSREHKKLKQDLATAFQDVATKIFTVSNSLSHPSTNEHLVDSTISERINKLDGKVDEIYNLMENNDTNGRAAKLSIQIGKHRFNSMEDVGAWADKHLPPDYPFGPFVDVYSFLERVKSAKDVTEFNSAVGEMDTRRKASLSADEAVVVEAFQHPLPRCFRGSTSSLSIGAWLPGIKNKDSWENRSSTRGTKLAIRDNMEGIRQRIEAIISTRLHNYSEAADLARVLLSDSVTFITTLSSYISGTQIELTSAGFPEDDAWNLVSKLVYRIFATDCYHDKRGVATELLDAADHRSMATGILWATFATHGIMREYLKYSFADHPSIAGEYTRFLVANAGISKLAKAEKTIERLVGIISSMEKKVEMLEKKATTASSRADEALKLAKKSKGT